MLAALRRSGVRVTTVVLCGPRDATRIGDLRVPLVLVDTIAAPLAGSYVARLRARGSTVVALAHMRTGALGLARRSDRVVVVSDAIARELVAAGIDRRRIVVVSPGRERITTPPRAERGRTVLCVANWTAGKGIHTLIAAARHVPNIFVDLVGDAPEATYAARVRRAIAAGGLERRVRVHGSLGGAALMRRYMKAGIFALPSIREGYPIVFAEALARGLPIIGCDIPGVREVTGGAAILVAPAQVRPLAAALGRLVADEPVRRELARKSLSRARQLPTWADSEIRFVRAIKKWARGSGTAATSLVSG